MQGRAKLADNTVADVRDLLVKHPSVIAPDAPIHALLQKIIEDPRTRHVYVVDAQKKLLGSVRMQTVVHYLFPLVNQEEEQVVPAIPRYLNISQVQDLMKTDPFYVTEKTTLWEVSRILMREKINELPVVDDQHRIIGQINVYEIILSYLSSLPETNQKKNDASAPSQPAEKGG